MSRFSTELKTFFFGDDAPAQVRLEELLHLGDEKIFGFLLAAFAFPCAIPIPHFGLSIPLGLILVFFASQLLLGQHQPWLPGVLLRQSVSLDTARKILNVGISWIERLEAVSQPRYQWLCHHALGKLGVGLILVIAGIVMAIPVPGTNVPPAVGIFVTGIGLLEEDGLICLAGLGISLLSIGLGGTIFSALLWGGASFFDAFHLWMPT